jgi:hypothetical protein
MILSHWRIESQALETRSPQAAPYLLLGLSSWSREQPLRLRSRSAECGESYSCTQSPRTTISKVADCARTIDSNLDATFRPSVTQSSRFGGLNRRGGLVAMPCRVELESIPTPSCRRLGLPKDNRARPCRLAISARPRQARQYCQSIRVRVPSPSWSVTVRLVKVDSVGGAKCVVQVFVPDGPCPSRRE